MFFFKKEDEKIDKALRGAAMLLSIVLGLLSVARMDLAVERKIFDDLVTNAFFLAQSVFAFYFAYRNAQMWSDWRSVNK